MGRSGAEQRQIAEGVQISLLQIFPERLRYVHRRFIRSKRRWILFASALLHLQVCLAERIRAGGKIITGKLITIPQTVLNPVHFGACQNGTGTAK